MFIESLRPPWVFRIKDFLICYLDSVLKTLPSITDGYQKLNNYNKKPEDLHLFQNVLIYIWISDAGQSAVCICKYHYQ